MYVTEAACYSVYILVSLPFLTWFETPLCNTADRIRALLSLKHLPGGVKGDLTRLNSLAQRLKLEHGLYLLLV